MVKYANLEDAKREVFRWNGDAQSIEHIGDRGNSVFSFRNSQGNLQILRFTDPEFRSFDELLAELDFVSRLHSDGVPVAAGIPTKDGAWAFQTECSSGMLICSSISFASGVDVQEGSPYWTADFFKEWGRNLALIHKSAASFDPRVDQPKRWQWDREILFRNALDLIPVEDTRSREEFHELIARCKALPKSSSTFGLIHADHAPQNFRYDISNGIITAFDFGNCCYHWFVSDLAISLSTVRRKTHREKIRANILEGYASVRDLPKDYDDLIDLFIRLRVLYVYLSRLHLWSVNRTSQQEKDLFTFKEMVGSKIGWPRP